MGQVEELNSFQAVPIPEFVIDLEKEGDDVIAFKIKNTSTVNLYNIGVVNIDTRAGEVCWWKTTSTGLRRMVAKGCCDPLLVRGISRDFRILFSSVKP